MTTKRKISPDLWLGIECTVNRVGDRYFDQCFESGHDERESDLEQFAAIGAKRIRYPFLWEKAASSEKDFDWRRFDCATMKLKNLGLTPIAGLLHHGSGPSFTHLLDPQFPQKFARYARAFAQRYPWIADYIPINEPLTTSRFSGLYGFWYPHERNDASFVTALYHQVEGIRLAMVAIREVNPQAQLIQTEDLGRATGTLPLTYQVSFENQRRWLSFDLLMGRVDDLHPLYSYLCRAGLTAKNLARLREKTSPPDILGINHYLLSNRFLDHRSELYPVCFRGGNDVDRYADVGAVDSGQAKPPSPESVIEEAWVRYARPLAITEVHLAGPREAQLRWVKEVWDSTVRLQRKGADIRAVTLWSLLGSYDWNSVCTEKRGIYECGIFDARSLVRPRPTQLTTMAKSLVDRGEFVHPVLEDPGWWQTPARVRFAHSRTKSASAPASLRGKPILIVGQGTLGRAFARACQSRGLSYRHLGRAEFDISQVERVRQVLADEKPWAVINAAGYVKVDQAEIEPHICFRDNVFGAQVLASECTQQAIRVVNFSSDLVFDGLQRELYMESSIVNPLSIYGQSKAALEDSILRLHPESLIIRSSSFFGPWDVENFVTKSLRRLNAGQILYALSDVKVTPTYVPDLTSTTLDLLIDGEKGLVHLVNQGAITWSDLAHRVLEMGSFYSVCPSLTRVQIREKNLDQMAWAARRPLYSALGSERVSILPTLDDALARYFQDLEVSLGPEAPSGHSTESRISA